MSLSPEDVDDILRILDSTDYDELDLETDRFALRLRRGPGGWTQEHTTRGDTRAASATAGSPAATAAATAPSPADEVREGLHPVRAPLPGVFYRAPRPGEPPFVEAGDHVEADTVVAILETMKLMNPVRAGAAGTVAEIVHENGQPAAQGAVLLWLEPATAEPATAEPATAAPAAP